MVTLEQGVELACHALEDTEGGEIYVKKIPSMKVTDVARAIDPDAEHKIVGIRPGEKLHEQMISAEDSVHTYEYEQHYKIMPAINQWGNDKRVKGGRKVDEGFVYSSDQNTDWMSVEALRAWMAANKATLGKV
jgi:FlaA1/EpsC-like NDP-sugar epimerase